MTYKRPKSRREVGSYSRSPNPETDVLYLKTGRTPSANTRKQLTYFLTFPRDPTPNPTEPRPRSSVPVRTPATHGNKAGDSIVVNVGTSPARKTLYRVIESSHLRRSL